MTAAKSVTATFNLVQRTLTVTTNGPEVDRLAVQVDFQVSAQSEHDPALR